KSLSWAKAAPRSATNAPRARTIVSVTNFIVGIPQPSRFASGRIRPGSTHTLKGGFADRTRHNLDLDQGSASCLWASKGQVDAATRRSAAVRPDGVADDGLQWHCTAAVRMPRRQRVARVAG